MSCSSQSQPWGAQSWWDWTEPLSQKPPASDYLWEPCFQPFSHSFPQAVIQQAQSAHSVRGAVLPSGSILLTPTGQGLTPSLMGHWLCSILFPSLVPPLLKAPFLKVPASAQELRGPHCSQEKRGHGQHLGGPHSDKGGAEAWCAAHTRQREPVFPEEQPQRDPQRTGLQNVCPRFGGSKGRGGRESKKPGEGRERGGEGSVCGEARWSLAGEESPPPLVLPPRCCPVSRPLSKDKHLPPPHLLCIPLSSAPQV